MEIHTHLIDILIGTLYVSIGYFLGTRRPKNKQDIAKEKFNIQAIAQMMLYQHLINNREYRVKIFDWMDSPQAHEYADSVDKYIQNENLVVRKINAGDQP